MCKRDETVHIFLVYLSQFADPLSPGRFDSVCSHSLHLTPSKVDRTSRGGCLGGRAWGTDWSLAPWPSTALARAGFIGNSLLEITL